MANEFVARKGLIALESSQITGSLNVSGGITGSLLGTSSWATNAISSSLSVQNLFTASVSLNTITFTKGDGTTFPIIVNTGSGGAGDNLGNHTATQDLDMATFNIKNLGVITGSGNAQVSVGRYNFGYELISTFPVTGSGLIVSSSNLPANHYNMVKVGNIELIDLNSGLTPNTFIIHNVDRLLIASGSEPVDIFTANNKLIDHNGSQFDVYTGGSTQTFRVTSGSSQFTNYVTFAEGIALKAASANLTHLAGWTSAPTLPTSDLIYLATSSLILSTSSIRNFPTEVSRSAAAAGFGSGGSSITLKAGSGSASSFGGTPRTASISFNTAFSSNAYSVVVTAEDARAWTIQSKTTTGFVINSNSSVGLIGPVYWIATGFSNS